jgi:dTDP-4-amino-4,6-dideoxygalactose transaminase
VAERAGARPAVAFVDLQAQRRRLGGRIERALAAVIEHGQFILGPEVSELERRLAGCCGVPQVVTCSSGTDALLMSLLAWGVGRGDAVYVPSLTFAATAEAVALVGATPVFVDVDPGTYTLDPDSLLAAARATAGLRPAAVIPVDLYGQPADYPAVEKVAREFGLRVAADAAQSFGATLDGRRVGALADVTATSFFPAKPLGCYGDGGAVFTNDDELAGSLRSLRVHGQGVDKYDNVAVGLNARLDTLQAAVLLEKLAIFDDELEARRRVAERYRAGLTGIVDVPCLREGATSAWAHYTVLVGDRSRVAARLHAAGIPTAVYYPRPLHAQAAYATCPRPPGGLPVAERLAGQVLSLPMHPYLDVATQDRIIAAVRASILDRDEE